ncbi:MAG: hypothetical protein Q9226_002279 [Calogaya cf. arnoldii]
MQSEESPNMNRKAAEEIFDNMNAFYKTAMEVFLDNVPSLIIQETVVNQVPRMLWPESVFAMESDLVSAQPSHQPEGPPSAPEASREDPISQTIDGPALTALNPRASLALVEGGRNYGIKVLYDNGNKACVDLVFVHGLTGNAYNIWLDKETGVHWSSELLGQDIPDSRVLSFGYDADVVSLWGRGPASSSRLSNHAESLVGTLVRERDRSHTETRKIIFVAYSLGGLVTEQALIHSKNSAEKDLNQIDCCTTGIVFLGVPHCGADVKHGRILEDVWSWLAPCESGMVPRTSSHQPPTTAKARATSSSYNIPFLRNRRFVGRVKKLVELEEKLMISNDCQKLALVGLGGVGKTQVTLELAYTVKERWPEYSIF